MTEMPLYEQVLTIAVCVLATLATRMVPFFLFRPGKNLPAYIQYLGKALPSAVFALLVVYSLKDIHFFSGNHGVPEVLSLAVTVAAHVRKRNRFFLTAGRMFYPIRIAMRPQCGEPED